MRKMFQYNVIPHFYDFNLSDVGQEYRVGGGKDKEEC